MTWGQTAVLAVIVAMGGVAYFATLPRAADAVCTSPVDVIVKQVETAGGSFVDLVDIPGTHADQMLVVTLGDKVQIGMVEHGCVVSSPFPVDDAKSKGQGV